jgi:hypothetical protein
MKNLHLSTIVGCSMLGTWLVAFAAQAHHGPHASFNVTPYGSTPVNGVVNGSLPNNGSGVTFGQEKQQKVNAAGRDLSVSSISGSQSVNGRTVNVPADAAQIALDVINTPSGASSGAIANLTTALGGGDAAQQLAQSLQGLRGTDGSVSPAVLSKAVTAYNDYLKSLVKADKASNKPNSDLATMLERLPSGQKAVQVILGRLVAATN